MRRLLAQLAAFWADIRLEHSLFALPFALIGALLACQVGLAAGVRVRPYPSAWEFLWLVVAMVGARSAAMGFNRVLDRQLDARNPRTAGRALVVGRAPVWLYWLLIALGAWLCWYAAGRFGPAPTPAAGGSLALAQAEPPSALLGHLASNLAQRLAPLALAVLFFYSFTKRFTWLCHFALGLALALSPLAAWVALLGVLPAGWPPYLLAAAVLFWVAGFDVIYATLDVEVDRAEHLHSLPARLGVPRALAVSRWLHLATAVCLVGFYLTAPGLAWGFGLALAGAVGLLAYEHALVRPDDLGHVNAAFFTVNAWLGFILLGGAAFDWLR